MKELSDIVKAWKSTESPETLVLATVVEVSGSTYRKPGARMLLADGAWLAGSVSGGCLEADLFATAWDRTEKGPALVTYDSSSDEDILWGFGLGCNGVVRVLVERVAKEDSHLRFLQDRLQHRTPGVIATALGEGPRQGTHWYLSPELTTMPDELAGFAHALDGQNRRVQHILQSEAVLFELVQPPEELVIFGAGVDAIPLVRMAAELGFRVTAVDHREAYAREERLPEAAEVFCLRFEEMKPITLTPNVFAVVMTHNFLNDKTVLGALLRSNVSYIGLLGPRRRADRILAELEKEGLDLSELKGNLHAPIGLDLGAEGPHEVALSILAEIQACRRGGSRVYLRYHEGPIHG